MPQRALPGLAHVVDWVPVRTTNLQNLRGPGRWSRTIPNPSRRWPGSAVSALRDRSVLLSLSLSPLGHKCCCSSPCRSFGIEWISREAARSSPAPFAARRSRSQARTRETTSLNSNESETSGGHHPLVSTCEVDGDVGAGNLRRAICRAGVYYSSPRLYSRAKWQPAWPSPIGHVNTELSPIGRSGKTPSANRRVIVAQFTI